jgi:hypothetical protein
MLPRACGSYARASSGQPLDITPFDVYYNIFSITVCDSQPTQPLLQKKLTQVLVAGNPKSVIGREMGVMTFIGLVPLKRPNRDADPVHSWDAYIRS